MTVEELMMRECIRVTHAAYAKAVDRGDFAAVVNCFAADASLEVPGGTIYRGYVGIAGFLDELGGRFAADAQVANTAFYLRHHLTTSSIELQPDGSARAWIRFIAMGPEGIDHTGAYTDRLVSTDAHWLLASRKISLDWLSPHSPVPRLMGLAQHQL